MRLIDADALNARMYHDAFETDTDMQKWDNGCWIRYKMFENAIAEAPTVEEPKTGKWIDGFCSECHQEAITEWDDCGGEYALTRYCPNCGADMRGEEHETN